LRLVLVTVAIAAVALPASATAAPVGGARYSGTTGHEECGALTAAREPRSLPPLPLVGRPACPRSPRRPTQVHPPAGDRSFAIKKGTVAKQISLGPAGSPAVGHLSVALKFGRTVSGSLSATWRYADGTTCTSGKTTLRARRGRYTPPRELSDPHPQHP